MSEGQIAFEFDPESRSLLDQLFIRFGKAKVFAAVVEFFARESLVIAGKISRIVLQTLRQQGNLARSITGRGELIDGIPACRVGILSGAALQYAGVQEFGTKGKDPSSPYPTIKPKNAKTLAMPVEDSLTTSGVPRYEGPKQDPRDLKFELIARGNLVGRLVVDTAAKHVSKARVALANSVAARQKLRALKDGDRSPEARAVRAAAKKAARAYALASSRAGQAQLDAIDKNRTAYLLLRKLDLEPRHYLRDNFLKLLPDIARKLAVTIGRYLNGSAA